MKSIIVGFLRDENGATAIEYAIIAAGLSVAILASVNTVGTEVVSLFTKVSEAVD